MESDVFGSQVELKLVSVEPGASKAQRRTGALRPEPIPLPTSKAPAAGAQARARPRHGNERVRAAGRRKGKLLLAGAAVLAGLVPGGNYGWRWWTVGQYRITTDNAYLQGRQGDRRAPRWRGSSRRWWPKTSRSGRATWSRLIDDARISRRAGVSGGRTRKRPRPARSATGRRSCNNRRRSRPPRRLVNAEAALTFAQQEFGRSEPAPARRRHDAATAADPVDLRQRQAARDKAQAALEAAEKQVETYKAQAGARATLDAARAKVEQAKLNLEYTTIRAPIDGVVGDRSLRKGQLVQPGTNLLTLVPMGADIYLVANFKETQTRRR